MIILQVFYGYQTTKPTRFAIDRRNFKDVVLATFPFIFRVGTGALISGYKISIEAETQEDKSQYSILSAFGYRIKEGTSVEFKKRPKKYLEIYEFEGCPYCRKVREAVSILDLDVIYYPCPKGGPNYRLKVKKIGGKSQFPYLIDPNTGIKMYESADIIEYLYETYGNGKPPPFTLSKSFLSILSLSFASLPRFGRGSKFVENKFDPIKQEPIIYWGYEGSPFCKLVREILEEYEIPHIQKTCPRGSSKRQELYSKTGIFQVPYIEDPNTGVKLFESADIAAYIEDKYGLKY